MIVVALGSNLSSKFGNRFTNIDLAISLFEKKSIKVSKKSSYYETPSYPNKNEPKFINVVISISSELNLNALIDAIIDIEKKFGRVRKFKNEPRTCDIDIIDYKNQIINYEYKNLSFTIPHKKMIYRNFVLFPIKEIIPKWIHPKTKDSVSSLIEKLPQDEKNSILKVNKS
tara:strand:+ start:450 stop:962 length:513 start_codon:yes stop_codon:yes gene_type:complete